MLWPIARFEIVFHLKNPLLYITAGLMLLMTFGAVSSDSVQIGGAVGNVHRNAPVVILQFMTIMSVIGLFIVTAFVSSSVHRDVELGTAELFFSRPIRKRDYLLGRFLGSLAVSVALFIGPALGILIGSFMPWLEAERLGPFSLAPYLYSVAVVVVPNVLFMAAVFFTVTVLTRSMMATYLGVVGFFVAYGMSQMMARDVEAEWIAALLDPFALATVAQATKYWTIVEQNTLLPPLGGLLLGNRLLWLSASVAVLAFGAWRFDPSRGRARRPRAGVEVAGGAPATGTLPTVAPAQPHAVTRHGVRDHLAQAVHLARFETGMVVRSIPFVVIVVFGVVNLLGSMSFLDRMYGTSVLPVTRLMLEAMDGTYLFLMTIVVTFFAGELIWRERTLRLAEVTDALPVPPWVPLVGKLSALALVVTVFTAVGMVATMLFQLAHGYSRLEPLLYAKGFVVAVVPFLLIAVLAVVVQVVAPTKMIGFLVMIVFLMSGAVLDSLDLEHRLYRFAGWPDAPYSDMNGYGHFVAPMVWFGLYWTFLALAMVGAAAALWRRGTDPSWRLRWTQARERAAAAARALVAIGLVGFVATGAFILYNTNVVNEYLPNDVIEARAAEYETLYRQHLGLAQPRITEVEADVDIFPAERRVEIRGRYQVVNTTAEPIPAVHVTIDPAVRVNRFALPGATLRLDDRLRGYAIYDLAAPLAPGAATEVAFDLSVVNPGFVNNGAMNTVAANGTFFNNREFFPLFGYLDERELTDRNLRREHDLPPVHRMAAREDQAARRNNYLTSDSDWITFRTTVSTSADQVAIAPGYLVREWQEGERRFFRYEMDAPILHFFSYLSAAYAVRRDRWHDVDIAVYYHPPHAQNVERMVDSVKKTLDYCTANFGPYQHRQVRILEFPRYASFAQSFPNTIPYSEAIGFIADIGEDDIDTVFYVTAHEVAHQWWAHQVIGANVQGATFMSESLAQYTALVVMEREYGRQRMRRFLKYELDKYLDGRGGELVEEMPLVRVENQGYIHYRKGSVVMYALRDALGEEAVNRALARYVEQTGFQQPPYTVSTELVELLRAAANEPWQQALLTDSLEHITVYSNEVTAATSTALADGRSAVEVTVRARKVRADGQGVETEVALDDWVDVGVRAAPAAAVVLALERRHITAAETTFRFEVSGTPLRAGVDPYCKLVDRDSDDNLRRVTAVAEAKVARMEE